MQFPSLRHCRKLLDFPTNVPEHTNNHATQGEEVETSSDPRHNNEGTL